MPKIKIKPVKTHLEAYAALSTALTLASGAQKAAES